MVKRLLKLLNREFNGLHEAAILLASAALASQVLALIRDRFLASTFGAGATLDVYYAAFRVPDFLYATIASLVSAAVVIPWLIKYLKVNDRAGARYFLDNLFTVFTWFLLVASGAAWLLMPWLTRWLAPGFDTPSQEQLAALSRIILLSPLFLGLSNLFGAVTQASRRFFLYAVSPLLYNLGIILGITVFYPAFGLKGLAWGVVAGALAHLLIQVPSVWHDGLLPRFRTRVDWPVFKKTLLVSAPRTLTLALSQLTMMILVALASFMSAGSIAVFNFAFNLQSVPLSIIGVSYSVAAFPTLANLFVGGERDKFLNQLTLAIRHILFWSIPATVLFVVLRAQIVRVILGAGSFDWVDTRLTAAALAIFIFSVVGQSLALLFVRGYYAAGRTRKPLLINLISAAVTILSAFFLHWLFSAADWWRDGFLTLLRVADLPGGGILTLPLAFSLGALVNLGLFWFWLQRDFGRFPKVIDRALGQSALASLVAGLVAYLALNWFDDIFDLNTFLGIAAQGAAALLLGVAALILILTRFRNRELLELKHSLGRKFWKTQAIAPEPEGL